MRNGDGLLRRLRIAQVAPLYESVPPRLYGGTERIASYLTEELVAQGHDVTLFASGDSETSAKLVAAPPHALRLGRCGEPLAHYTLGLAYRQQGYVADAMKAYQMALEKGEDRALVMQAMAELHLIQKEPKPAIEDSTPGSAC